MPAQPSRICVVGSLNIDLTVRMPRLPRPGETLAGHGLHFGFGGKGANQAVMAARLGAQVSMVGRVGHDPFGEQTLASFREHGIDATHVRVDESAHTGTAAILVDDEACNCIVVVAGANAALTPADVQAAASVIRAAVLVLCQLEVPMETTLAAFRLAREAGGRTVLNPAPAVPLPAELLRLTDLCVLNETEVEVLTGLLVNAPEQAEAAARMLMGWGVPAVLITLGDKGAVLVEGSTVVIQPAIPVTAADPTGAGDAFIGSLAVYWGQGMALGEAMKRATAVAALAVTRPGAQHSFPTRQAVEAFLAQHGLSDAPSPGNT